MGIRENKVETYLDEQVTAIDGMTRKWVSPGHDGVPDRIVIHRGRVCFVEVKTTDGDRTVPQQREHKRLKDHGAEVTTVYGHNGVDLFVHDLMNDRDLTPQNKKGEPIGFDKLND